MAHPYDDRYRERSYRDRGDRNFFERAGEEVRSWFGGRDRDRMPERGSRDEEWQNRERWGGDYRRDEFDRPRGESRGWQEPEYGRPASEYGYGDRMAREGDRGWSEGPREADRGWTDRATRDRDWGPSPRRESDWDTSRWARDDESRYGDWWAQRQRDWRYEGTWPRQGRTAGEARGIYEDDYGRVHQFAHRSEGNFAGRGPKGYRRSDERIREDICERLTEDWRVDASDIEVAVNNGDVTLTGMVHTRDEKRATEDLIEHVRGVRDVHNELRVSRWDDAGQNPTASSAAHTPPPAGQSTAAPRR